MLVWMNFRKSRAKRTPGAGDELEGRFSVEKLEGIPQWHTGSTGECKHLLTIMKSIVCRIRDY